jgi:hypothetical protein
MSSLRTNSGRPKYFSEERSIDLPVSACYSTRSTFSSIPSAFGEVFSFKMLLKKIWERSGKNDVQKIFCNL